ncbi:uncharacterized protein J4E88_000306 [Alternaria novae-zelandiae]|uniref:uncharacterized protein n=1 Tax=Alternaria metachromatica TaxID=283354 RepID=UPI0020C3B629|nr:uncharacterized protein J4E83_003024 [Alternaria metachromatica]XP_049259814.1 uncharacterized protein J4E88_000306 [Alternaria novae-zelandiae]XP_051294885.1 uncharacterized protein J4E90_002170 [Alternaria incomplexa]XP_051306448.1 uncharacterized protein J4E86_002300 [Alternaria arbusti]KAI4630388.1 hypothetical protein J4E80_001323 [Alternaria sp. BMP 0032]KAI4628474.1 hypothetical protein J4E83_003024 [Alternaria metachromatica]KAI4696134.1 hypothetical protein J4E88_000306 [Alternari
MTMNETIRIIGMLRASAAQNADQAKLKEREAFFASANETRKKLRTAAAARKSTSVSLLEDLIYATKHGVPYPNEPLTYEAKVAADRILVTLNKAIARETILVVPNVQPKETSEDLANDLAIENSKRIFTARSNIKELQLISSNLGIPITSPAMAGRFPVLSTSDLPKASAEEQSATASPARGTAMLNNIFKSVRVPEFRFKWMFWAEKGQQAAPKDKAASEEYLTRPKPLGDQIVSVKEFYQHFNNIPVENLKLRDSIHLFHLGVKPVWEDPRNTRGGAWYFKVSKDVAAQFWHEMCLLAVGDVLQGAVETKRASFNDDICGISYSVRWNAVQIAVWNRDAENEDGRQKLLAVILDKLSEELRPKKEDSYWYKAHKEHKGFIEQ